MPVEIDGLVSLSGEEAPQPSWLLGHTLTATRRNVLSKPNELTKEGRRDGRKWGAMSIGSRGFHSYLSGGDSTYWREEYNRHPLGARLSEIGMSILRFKDLLAIRCGRMYTTDEVRAFMRVTRVHPPEERHRDAIAEIVGVEGVEEWWG